MKTPKPPSRAMAKRLLGQGKIRGRPLTAEQKQVFAKAAGMRPKKRKK